MDNVKDNEELVEEINAILEEEELLLEKFKVGNYIFVDIDDETGIKTNGTTTEDEIEQHQSVFKCVEVKEGVPQFKCIKYKNHKIDSNELYPKTSHPETELQSFYKSKNKKTITDLARQIGEYVKGDGFKVGDFNIIGGRHGSNNQIIKKDTDGKELEQKKIDVNTWHRIKTGYKKYEEAKKSKSIEEFLRHFPDIKIKSEEKKTVIGDFELVGWNLKHGKEIRKLSKREYNRIRNTLKSETTNTKERLEKAGKSKSIEEFLSYFPDRETVRKEREEERREKLIKRLKKNEKYLKGKLKDIENMELSMLEDLSQELKENPEYQKEVEKEWKEREKGIVNGINYMVQKGLIVDNKNKKITNKQLYAEPVGGSSQSDIKVHLIDKDGNDKSFFIESKLTYDTAEYFKFNVTVDGNKIKYDHKFHRNHIDKTKSEEEQKKELKKIDDIFKKIDLGGIITEVIAGTSDNELTQEWKTFIDNWNEMIRFIQKMFEKDSSFEGYKFESPNNKFPEQFMLVGKYYQHYFEFYADVYDKIIDKIFERYIKKDVLKDGKETFTRDDFKLQRSETNKDRVLQSASRLRTFIPENKIEETNPLFDEIIKIEGKFSALSKRLSKKINDFRDLSLNTKSKNDAKIVSKYSGKISSKDSLKYFYQMFISTTGRKTKNSETFKEVGNESLGVMQLTPIVEFQTKKINQAITIYYLNKDNVAYLQVLKDIFMLRKDFDPLGLVDAIGKDYKINLLNEVDNKFTCSLVVSDDLSEISLHVRMDELEDENRKEISFDVRDKGQGFIGTDFQGVKKNKLHIKEKDFGRKFNTKNISDKKQISEEQQEIEDEVIKILNESPNEYEDEIEEGLETEKTQSNKYELKVTEAVNDFLKSQKSPYNTLSVEHYEGSDSKYWSDISVTNPKNSKRFWIEAKEDKYACLGSMSWKYKEGKWTCTTLEDNNPLLPEMLKDLEENSGKFIQFCKDYLGKEDITLPRDLTDELVYAWRDSGSIQDTENDVLFITEKIPMDDFGSKIASFYKFSKNEPAYYIHVGDELYLIDGKTNVLGLRTKDGKPLKTLSEVYRIGRIQFRLKGYDRPQKHYWSVYTDIKILSDKENLDENYNCSFLDPEKWPVIDDGNSEVPTDKTKELQADTEDEKEIEEQFEDICNEEELDEYKKEFHLKDKEHTYKPEKNKYAFKNKSEKYGGDDYITSLDVVDRIDHNLHSKFGPGNWFRGPDRIENKNSKITVEIDDGKDTRLNIKELVKSKTKGRVIYIVPTSEKGMTTDEVANQITNMSDFLGSLKPYYLVIMNENDESTYVCNGIRAEGNDIVLEFEWGDLMDYSKELDESFEDYKLLTNLPKDTIENILDNTKIENPRYKREQFEKYFGIQEMNWCVLANKEDNLAVAAINENHPFKEYYYIAEIQNLKKGYGKPLIEELIRKYKKVWLMADTTQGDSLMNYYRKLGLEEVVIEDSVYGVPAHFFMTKDCDYEKLETYLIAFYSNEEDSVDEELLTEYSPYGNIRLGMIVKNLKGRYLDRLLDGTKTIETRYEKTWNMMKKSLEGKDGDEIIGQNIALMQDSHTVNAIAKITDIVTYGTRDDFENGYEDHLVNTDDENVGWNEKKGPKIGIKIEIVQKFNPPKELPRVTMKGNPMAHKVMHGFVDDSDRISVLDEAEQYIDNEDDREYAYHVSNISPEIIKKDGFKSGLGNGGTDTNLFDDLYKEDYPKNYLFISKEPWDDKRDIKFKYAYKIDITDLDLYPDFGMLLENGAYYDENYNDGGYEFWWKDRDLESMENKKLKELIEKQNGSINVNEMMGGETVEGDYFPEALYDALGSAVIDGDKVNMENRIVDVITRNDIKEAEQDIGGEKSDIADEFHGDKIWIDDIREAPEGFKWFHTVREFIKYIDEHGTQNIELIDTDHDAGDYQKFGGDYIRCFDYLDFIGAKNITIHIHSANPVGANNIRRIISKNKEENGWREVRNTSK